MKNVLAFLITVRVGVAAGTCLVAIDTVDEVKRRATVSSRLTPPPSHR
jgi:hypothetical protein